MKKLLYILTALFSIAHLPAMQLQYRQRPQSNRQQSHQRHNQLAPLSPIPPRRYPTAQRDFSYEQEGNDSYNNSDSLSIPSAFSTYSSHNTNKSNRSFKSFYLVGKWCCLFGFLNSSIVAYFGIKNLFSKEGNRTTGFTELLIGGAGIALSAYTNEQFSKFYSVFKNRS